MAKPPSIEEAVERAQQAQLDKVNAIRALAEARANLAAVQDDAKRRRAELESELSALDAEAQRVDQESYSHARSVGWSEVEIRKIGFAAPGKAPRTRARNTRPKSADTTATTHTPE